MSSGEWELGRAGMAALPGMRHSEGNSDISGIRGFVRAEGEGKWKGPWRALGHDHPWALSSKPELLAARRASAGGQIQTPACPKHSPLGRTGAWRGDRSLRLVRLPPVCGDVLGQRRICRGVCAVSVCPEGKGAMWSWWEMLSQHGNEETRGKIA